MSRLIFVVPVHGRLPLATICLRQLRRTCDLLAPSVEASAVVVSDRDTLRTLRRRLRGLLGFGTVERDNHFLGQRFNDGIQLALDPDFNPRPADYVVPIGSDDWIDHRLLLSLPQPGTMVGFQHVSFVREDGRELTGRYLRYTGGCGIRIWPRDLMEVVGYRPCEEDRKRAIDTSILYGIQRVRGFTIEHRLSDPRQIVDWKTRGGNLNPYDSLRAFKPTAQGDPFELLADVFPAESLRDMQAHYERQREQAAA